MPHTVAGMTADPTCVTSPRRADRSAANHPPAAVTLQPTLPGRVDGVVAVTAAGTTVQCSSCGMTRTGQTALEAMTGPDAIRFHLRGWGDGSNPRLCRACRLGRGCTCQGCESERQGTQFPTMRRQGT